MRSDNTGTSPASLWSAEARARRAGQPTVRLAGRGRGRFRGCGLAAGALLAVLAAHADASDLTAPDTTDMVAGLRVAFWMPPQGRLARSARHPLVLFSHGFGGCSTQSGYLMRAFAGQGFVVAAPDHRDEQCGAAGPPTSLPASLGDPQNWAPEFHKDRGEEISALRAALERDGSPAGPVDPSRVVLVGHSLGGYTVLALAGGWPQWRRDGVAAVVALAPFAEPLTAPGGALEAIQAPVLLQAGTADPLVTPSVETRIFPALAAASPACLVVLPDAGHFAWTALETTHHAATATVAVAFVEEVLTGGRPGAASLRAPATARTTCR